MADLDMPNRLTTDDEIRELFHLEADQATAHRRCGANAHCRRDPLHTVDDILDAWLRRHPTQP